MRLHFVFFSQRLLVADPVFLRGVHAPAGQIILGPIFSDFMRRVQMAAPDPPMTSLGHQDQRKQIIIN